MVVGQVCFQWLFMIQSSWAKRQTYAILALSVSMIGSVLLLPLILLAHFSPVLPILATLWPLAVPLKDSEFHDLWKNDVCLQSTYSTCGPASVCSILRRLGTNVSEKEVARAAFTYAGGTEAWYLARYVRSKGFITRFDFRPSFSPEVGFPAVLGVSLGGSGHFIAILDITDNIVTFADPLHGQERIPVAAFQKRYPFSGFHLVITKPTTRLSGN